MKHTDAIAKIEAEILLRIADTDDPQIKPLFDARAVLKALDDDAPEPKPRKPRAKKRGLPEDVKE